MTKTLGLRIKFIIRNGLGFLRALPFFVQVRTTLSMYSGLSQAKKVEFYFEFWSLEFICDLLFVICIFILHKPIRIAKITCILEEISCRSLIQLTVSY